jgi:hypothetical protein
MNKVPPILTVKNFINSLPVRGLHKLVPLTISSAFHCGPCHVVLQSLPVSALEMKWQLVEGVISFRISSTKFICGSHFVSIISSEVLHKQSSASPWGKGQQYSLDERQIALLISKIPYVSSLRLFRLAPFPLVPEVQLTFFDPVHLSIFH